MALPIAFRRYQNALEQELRSVLGQEASPLYTMMRYHLGWVDEHGRQQQNPGKMSRPTLCLLACEAVGGDWRTALPAAAAVELIHNFSLIHDDIQDCSWERRKRPTVWKIWGEPQAINAGDAMYVLAQLALFRLQGTGIAPGPIVILSRKLNQASLQLCEGQYLDIEYENRLGTSIDEYLEMIGKKTAALFECALFFGAFVGTSDERQVQSLCSFGWNLGMAYQVQNDVEGIWGAGEGQKQSPYTDIRSKKKTLPVIFALRRASGEDGEGMRATYSKEMLSSSDINRVLAILDTTESKAYSEQVRDKYYRQCLEDLERAQLPPSPQRELKHVAAFLLGEEVDSR
jgi:geranylgeranyl diphosphate synthase type I